VLLSAEELIGFSLSNRPRQTRPGGSARPDVVLVAERFPARDDPLVELAGALERARVESITRPAVPDLQALRTTHVDYLEDDGAAARALAALTLALRHPLRSSRDRLRHRQARLPLRALAPAALRLERDSNARVHSIGGGAAAVTAARLAALAGRELAR
jgi:hypothetical protein